MFLSGQNLGIKNQVSGGKDGGFEFRVENICLSRISIIQKGGFLNEFQATPCGQCPAESSGDLHMTSGRLDRNIKYISSVLVC
jgi:hypothetical protein